MARLGLDMAVERADLYEVTSRTFASLPTATSVLRILHDSGRRVGMSPTFFDRLRNIQHRLAEQGLIASHIGRRVGPDGIDALILGVWTDRAAIEAASGQLDAPAYLHEIEPWILGVTIEMYAALEIAPRLPMASGPPVMILDGSRRVVDLTPSAAATLGRPQEEAAGELIEELAAVDDREQAATWAALLEDSTLGDKTGVAAWSLGPEGHVMIRWRMRRDVPVPGRHTILVRRALEPEPTSEELDAALTEAFPRTEVPAGG